jgi:D-amino peptidase
MRIYVSADIEGVAGIAHWDEARPEHPAYAEFRERMTAHVAAACEGAVAAGATEILVQDAHAHGRNVDGRRLPECARLLRGWSGHPLMMVQEIQQSFDAVLMVGYHAAAGSGGNPLAHSMSSSKIALLVVNGKPVTEFHLHAWAAALHGVPVVFVSGDEALCAEVQALNPHIRTCPVLRGIGASTVSLHPAVAERGIRTGVEGALRSDLSRCRLVLPERFRMEVHYREPARAYEKGFYPGAHRVSEDTVVYEHDQYLEVLRALKFLI